MALCNCNHNHYNYNNNKNSLYVLFLVFLITVSFSNQIVNSTYSQSFPLKSLPLFHTLSSLPQLSSKLLSSNVNFKTSAKYSMALVVSLPIGTPPQIQQMVLDTGSQLSWLKCHDTTLPKRPPLSSSFDPSLSSSFSLLPCNHRLCKPRIPDFTLPTSCDQNRLCHYSYFYADGTLAEGNLVRERITLSGSQITPPLIFGCTKNSDTVEGILGMNLGRLSFASQLKVSKFSYCVPTRASNSVGIFNLGENPSSGTFRYIGILAFNQSQRMPNFDQAAYTVGMEGIRFGRKRLNISRTVFRPDAGGSGQTMIDSGTEYTFLVESAYSKVREEVARLVVGPTLKKDFVYQGALDLCYDGNAMEIGRLVGDLVLEFEKGVEIVVNKERVFTDIGSGVGCLSIGRSDLLGVESNIIGNFHQQNLWVEFDLANQRVGFGEADCSRSM